MVRDYKNLLVRVQRWHGVEKPITPFTLQEMHEYMDMRRRNYFQSFPCNYYKLTVPFGYKLKLDFYIIWNPLIHSIFHCYKLVIFFLFFVKNSKTAFRFSDFIVSGFESQFDKKAFGSELELTELEAFFRECDLFPSCTEIDEGLDVTTKGTFLWNKTRFSIETFILCQKTMYFANFS